MTGWSPAGDVPKAAKRGSATISFHEMAEALAQRGGQAGSVAPAEGGEGSSTPASSQGSEQGSRDGGAQ